MANENDHNCTTKELQLLLVYGPPKGFPDIESRNSHKYRFLKAFSSKLPLLEFLAAQNVDPSSIRAILCNPLQRVTADIIQLLPSLRIIVTTSNGTNHIDAAECHSREIEIFTAGGKCAEDVAELAVGLLIDAMWKISAADRQFKKLVPSKLWNLFRDLKLGGKRVGIIGLGKIGGEVAKRLEAFNCRIMYHSRNKKPFVSYPFYSDVVELASDSDILVLCCPLNEETRHIINREVMLALGKEGFIINVGRGPLIDEKELVRCLVEGDIGGAGLDVFENEPNVPKELFSMDNVVLSPHHGSCTVDRFASVREVLAEILEAFFAGNPLSTTSSHE